jgi:hypothetical protein
MVVFLYKETNGHIVPRMHEMLNTVEMLAYWESHFPLTPKEGKQV